MKQFYTWDIHDEYARYWTKESIIHQEAFKKLINIEGESEFGPLYDTAEQYLANIFNPNDLKIWNPPILQEELDEGRERLQGDMHSTWAGQGYLLSQNMVNKLGDILNQYGQLFPLKVEDREDKLYRYWVSKEIPFAYVDKEKSKFLIMNIVKMMFLRLKN